MTKMERKILKRVILRSDKSRLNPHETVSQDGNSRFRSFLKSWKEPDDFSVSFQYLMNNLPEKNRQVLFMKYGENIAFSQIAERLQTAVSVIQHYEREAILSLAMSPNKEILLYGLRDYQKCLSGKGGTKLPDEAPLSQVEMPSRLYHALRRAGCNTIYDVTHASLSSLAELPSIGPKYCKEIVRIFENLGYTIQKSHFE